MNDAASSISAVTRELSAYIAAAVDRALPGAEVHGIAAGLHAVVTLPDGADEARVIQAARERGIALEGLADFHDASPARPALVLGYANLPEAAIARGDAAVAEAIRAAEHVD